jgi:undecaprenyl-diphosphatase
MLCVGAAILWLAERWGARDRDIDGLTFGGALAVGVAQAVALVPGVSRSGISISAGMFLGLRREAAARFSFLLATPAVAAAGAWEGRKLISGEAGVSPDAQVVVIGFVSSFLAGLAAIRFMLEFLKRQPNTLFIVYRVLLAIAVFVILLSPHGA